ncbi:unnamed protein product [Miscanthus lutarioriparius]|uniref:Homeobox domain-containing protein n=1 Tax=Miscanthus lutarioriparius TaxID=422564 RepID=A0A811R4I7_9POAL|nr:unnamed protein product [Miscanthus lutarioriparius]
MQNMLDGHHQLAMMQQQQHQNHGQQQQHPPQVATSESDARGPRHDELLMESKSASDNMEGGAGSGSGGEELEPLQVKFWFQNKRTQMKIEDEVTRIHAYHQY